MCGRFAVDKSPEEIAAEVQAEWADDARGIPSWNTCPTAYSPVLHNEQLHSWSWGLIPSWSKDDKRRAGLINARIETVDEKPSYRSLLGRRQCIIPCNGWFEWARKGKEKIPWYFTGKGPQMLYMAGLWDLWHNDQGEPVKSFTVLTREAYKGISDIHHRMPVLLDLETAIEWSCNNAEVEEILDASLEDVNFYRVGKEVNSVRNNDDTLIKPYNPPEQQGLF